MTQRQRPTSGENNLYEWSQYDNAPKERRNNIVSETVTIYGEAPSGAHEAEPRWIIWKETRQDNGQILREYAQDGRNDLLWIYNSNAFNPVPDPTGTPYAILLDNQIVFDGMGAGLPVANITVLDVDDIAHTITDIYDPSNKFIVMGNTLLLSDSVQLIDIAYPLKLRAVDDDGNIFEQMFTITVEDPSPAPQAALGELNIFEEDLTVASAATVAIIDYTVPANRTFRIRKIYCAGGNRGRFEVEISGVKEAEKRTYYTYFDTSFDFENIEVTAGETIKIYAENLGSSTACYNSNLRGYQYAT
jgi:hypothetical protein